jgi:hypothetical protein
MTTFLSEADLERMKFPVPRDFSETRDAIGSLIVRAPDYTYPSFPEYNIDVAYSMVLLGLTDLERKARSEHRRAIFQECRGLLLDAYSAFKAGDEDKGYIKVQLADVAFRKKPKKD